MMKGWMDGRREEGEEREGGREVKYKSEEGRRDGQWNDVRGWGCV